MSSILQLTVHACVLGFQAESQLCVLQTVTDDNFYYNVLTALSTFRSVLTATVLHIPAPTAQSFERTDVLLVSIRPHVV
jgi:hypothetical protein